MYKKIFIKELSPTILGNHIIDEYRRYFVRLCRLHSDTTNIFQMFCISKRNTGNPCPMPTWIDTYNKLALPGIGVVFAIKLFHYFYCFRVITKRIYYPKSSW